MGKRHRDALFIWEGACNPSGIAHSIVSACAEARADNADVRTDPAIRLMVAQLAYIMRVWDGVSDLACGDTLPLSNECKVKSE